MTSKQRVMIVDDHTLLRAGLRALLSLDTALDVVGEFGDGREAVRAAGVLVPDLVLMDINMPNMNGIEAVAEIKRRNPRIKVLVLTLHREDEYVQESLRAGADGYLLKDASHDELRVAIRSLLNGKSYLSPDVSDRVIHGYLGRESAANGLEGRGVRSKWDSVTRRERQVLKLIAEGSSNRDIADYLSLSVKTIEKHRSNLMKKLDLHNASMLTAFAIEKGLVESSGRRRLEARARV
jgi:DNA-binding NarL/FixJ family response regulator